MNDVKSADRRKLLNRWRQKCSPPKIIEPMTLKQCQKCSPLQIIELLTEKTWGQGCLTFRERTNRAKWWNFFKNEEIFWMNNKAIIEFGFRRIWRMRPLWIIPSLICRILHILRKANSIIALLFIQNISSFLKEFRHYALCFSAHQI